MRPAASWGEQREYLDGIHITVADEPAGRGPVGSAIREGRHIICNDLLADDRMAPWRERARRSNYHSVSAFPIVVHRYPIGALAIYAADKGFFDDENVALLDELAANLGFALESIAAEQERRYLEEQLRSQNIALEEQNRRVQEASRMKSEFLANMSHELRSPLNGIIGFTEMLYDGKLGPIEEKPREFLNRIHKNATHLLQLVNGVLDLSKVEAGRLDLRAEWVRLGSLLQEVTGTLAALAAEKKIRIETELDSQMDTVFTDVSRLKQVLYNYLSNAIKFTGEGGKVTLRLVPQGADEFRIEVSDTGIGIAAADLPRLFTEFQQLDSTAAKRYQGTGLGLALTKRVVEAQGGRVGVESQPGRGSTFYAVLPANSAVSGAKEREGVA